MEDENYLELSLGLFCGASSSNKSKGNASDHKTADGGKKEMMIGSLHVTGASLVPLYSSNIDSNSLGGQQRHEGFWKGLGQQTAMVEEDGSKYRQVWGIDDKMTIAEDKLGLSKRKMPFENVNVAKRPGTGREENEAGHKSLNDGGLKSHISVNSEDGSSAENEAVAESETEASNSWLVSQRKDVTTSSEAHNFSDNKISRKSDLLSQGKGPSNFSTPGSKIGHGNFSYGILPSLQPGPGNAMPVKPPDAASASNTIGTTLSSVMQLTPVSAAADPSMLHTVKSNSLPTLPYHHVQLPTLETSSSWMLGPPLDRKSTVDAQPNLSRSEDKMKAFQVMAFEGKTFDPLKGSGKHIDDVGTSSSQPEEETDGNKPSPQIEGFPSEGSIIRPGIASGLKFGGCGSYPDLPWVSVTGSGPNGKTISGVTYKFSKNQIKIVCACHGLHMTPEEFIHHANAVNPDGENNVGLAPFLNGNPSASAQS